MLIESAAYLNLTSVYRGDIAAGALLAAARADPGLDFCTLGYGIAHAFALAGNVSVAVSIWHEIVDGAEFAESEWASFGYIAAEAELAGRRVLQA